MVKKLSHRQGKPTISNCSTDRGTQLVKKKLVTRRELAQNLNVVMQTVTKWEQAGMPVEEPGRKGKPSLYSEPEVRKWLTEREKAAQKNGMHDVARERARKERAQAILAEQTYALRARDLLPRVQAEKAWATEVMAVRAKFLSWPATVGDRLARVAMLKGKDEFKRSLKEEIKALLMEFSTREWAKKGPRAKKTQAKKPRGSGSRKK